MVLAMLVDLANLPADHVHDRRRCGIGLHPLHPCSAIRAGLFMSAFPKMRIGAAGPRIHMALDWGCCPCP